MKPCKVCCFYFMGNLINLASSFWCWQDDVDFTTTLNFRLLGNQMVQDEFYQVEKTCSYATWASREIICNSGYMEASEGSRPPGGQGVLWDLWFHFPSRLMHLVSLHGLIVTYGCGLNFRCLWEGPLPMITPFPSNPSQGQRWVEAQRSDIVLLFLNVLFIFILFLNIISVSGWGCRFQSQTGGVLHPWGEDHGSDRCPENIHDHKHGHQAVPEKPTNLFWDLHSGCKQSLLRGLVSVCSWCQAAFCTDLSPLQVSGVTMTVLKTSIVFENKWMATRINAAAACPTPEGEDEEAGWGLASRAPGRNFGHLILKYLWSRRPRILDFTCSVVSLPSWTGSVFFTENSIRWFLPQHIDPLISGQFQLLEVHVGIDGSRLDPAEAAARRYSLTVGELYVVLEIPFGAAGGHIKVGDSWIFICLLHTLS